MGININEKKPNHLRFADDVVRIAFASEELETTTKNYKEYMTKYYKYFVLYFLVAALDNNHLL